MALLLFVVLASFAIQKFLTIDPTIIGLAGMPMIILLVFIGSMTVIVPVPVLPLVFTGAAILNPVGARYSCRCKHYCGHGRLLHSRTTRPFAGCTSFGRIAGQSASADFKLLLVVD